jgi:CheY-like chemotaxis protein
MVERNREYVAVTFSSQSCVAYLLKGVLDCAGFAVSAALSDPEELELLARSGRPDVIVYDVSFPFGKNWQTLQRLRSLPALRNVPVVVTTSEPRELFRATGCASAIEMFTRPDDVSEFRRALQRAIEAVAPAHDESSQLMAMGRVI